MSRRRKPADAPVRRAGDSGAVILGGAGAGDGPVKISGDVLIVDVDSRALVDVARRAILAELREQILEGVAPDGSPQPPLSRRAALQPRESPHRGFKTGEMADGLRSSPIKGDAGAASSTILPPTNRNVVLSKELQRGHEYIGLGPRTEAAAMRAIDEAIDAILDGRKVEAEQGEPRAEDEGSGS